MQHTKSLEANLHAICGEICENSQRMFAKLSTPGVIQGSRLSAAQEESPVRQLSQPNMASAPQHDTDPRLLPPKAASGDYLDKWWVRLCLCALACFTGVACFLALHQQFVVSAPRTLTASDLADEKDSFAQRCGKLSPLGMQALSTGGPQALVQAVGV